MIKILLPANKLHIHKKPIHLKCLVTNSIIQLEYTLLKPFTTLLNNYFRILNYIGSFSPTQGEARKWL